jgi:hypothetical protein
VKRPGDRCTCWCSHIDYKGLAAWAKSERARDVRMSQCGHARRRGA